VKRVAGALAALVVATGVNLATGVAIAPTTTAGALGDTVPGGSTDSPGAGYKFGSIYALSNTATLTDFKWYAGGGSSDQSFVTAIYNIDGTGTPSTLVATGTAVTIHRGQTPGWVTSTLPRGVTIQPGNYMLALLSGPSGVGAHIYYDTGANNAGSWNANAYPTLSTTWGQVHSETQHWSFYVDDVTAAPPTAPTNQTPPTISGTLVVGQVLTATAGIWTGAPTGFSDQWQRCRNVACTDMLDATNSSYLVSRIDVGFAFQVAVTANNSAGSTAATSQQTAVVTSSSDVVQESFTKFVIDPTPPRAC
jgi:hypothetical protein